MPHDPIDLDALVDALEREKADGKPCNAVEPLPPVKAAEPVSAPPVPPHLEWESVEEPTQADAPAEAETMLDAAYAVPPLRFEETAPSVTRRSARKQRRKERRRIEPEIAMEEWADWGLDPLGTHSNTPAFTHEAAQEPPQTSVLPIETTTPEAAVSAPEPPAATTAGDAERVPAETPASEEPDSFAGAEEFPPVHAREPEMSPEPVAAQEPEDLTPTRIIPIDAQPAESPAESPAPANTPAEPEETLPEPLAAMPDQLSLEELVRVETVEGAEELPEENPAERLHQTREEKIRDFVLAGEEETNEPEEEPEPPEEEPEEIEDFTSYDEAQAVRLELQYRRRMAGLAFLLSTLLETAVLVLSLLMTNGLPLLPDMGFLTVQAFVLVLLAVLNYPSVARGTTGLASLRANGDSSMTAAMLFGLGGVVVRFFQSDAPIPIFPALAGLSAVATAAARYVQAIRIQNNFSFIAYPGKKYTASLVSDAADLQEIGRRVSMDGDAKVAYFHPAAFLSEYLERSEKEDGGDRCARRLTPIVVLLSLAIPTALLLSGALKGAAAWLEACGYLLCLSAVPVGLVTQLLLRHCSNRMLQKGGLLAGYEAVQTFGSPDGVTLDVADLYPDESMLLHGIKTFSGTHIDEAIIDAASLSIRAGGPLSCIFCRIIENKMDLLAEVDSLVYEQNMGLSGWVNGRRVLVGNRRLLQNHGVDVPSADYEARYAKDGRQLVYLSTAGELSAMFVVSYQPDEEIRLALQELCRAKVTLLLRSCDPNITAKSLCRDFDLDEYYVEVLPTPAGRICERLMAEESAQAPAVLASNGHILGTANALAVCRSLRSKYRIAQTVGTVTSGAGLLLGAWWALKGIGGYAVPALLYTIAASLVTMIAPLFRRIG